MSRISLISKTGMEVAIIIAVDAILFEARSRAAQSWCFPARHSVTTTISIHRSISHFADVSSDLFGLHSGHQLPVYEEGRRTTNAKLRPERHVPLYLGGGALLIQTSLEIGRVEAL